MVVDLAEREPLPAVGSVELDPLRVGVGAMLSAEKTAFAYADLAEYLGAHLGRPVVIIQRRTYAELNQEVAAGNVDIAFVCTSAYIEGSEKGYMDLLVVPEVKGKTTYHSSLIVPAGSEAISIEDLRGSRFAFTDPMSLTGRVYPAILVADLGESPDSFFRETVFTYSHDRAIKAVAAGVVDGAGVDNLILEDLIQETPSIADGLRVISESPEFGIPPVVVPADTPPALRERFTELLTQLDAEPELRAILGALGIDRYVTASDDIYDGVRVLIDRHELTP